MGGLILFLLMLAGGFLAGMSFFKPDFKEDNE